MNTTTVCYLIQTTAGYIVNEGIGEVLEEKWSLGNQRFVIVGDFRQ